LFRDNQLNYDSAAGITPQGFLLKASKDFKVQKRAFMAVAASKYLPFNKMPIPVVSVKQELSHELILVHFCFIQAGTLSFLLHRTYRNGHFIEWEIFTSCF